MTALAEMKHRRREIEEGAERVRKEMAALIRHVKFFLYHAEGWLDEVPRKSTKDETKIDEDM